MINLIKGYYLFRPVVTLKLLAPLVLTWEKNMICKNKIGRHTQKPAADDPKILEGCFFEPQNVYFEVCMVKAKVVFYELC